VRDPAHTLTLNLQTGEAPMVDRMMRAVRADVSLYEEVEANPSYQQEGYTIVGIVAVVSAAVSILFGLGDIVAALIAAVVGLIFTFLGYFVWSFVIYFLGTRVFNGTADYPEMQRTLAYSYTPQIFSFVNVVPVVGPILGLVVSLWSAYLAFVAIRQGLDLDTTKAAITTIVSWIVLAIILAIPATLLVLLGVGAAAVGAS
jgi:hypothetical protein